MYPVVSICCLLYQVKFYFQFSPDSKARSFFSVFCTLHFLITYISEFENYEKKPRPDQFLASLHLTFFASCFQFTDS